MVLLSVEVIHQKKDLLWHQEDLIRLVKVYICLTGIYFINSQLPMFFLFYFYFFVLLLEPTSIYSEQWCRINSN